MAKVIIFSGAGISAPSGISTFRQNDGLWEQYDIKRICTAGCLSWNRDETIEFYDKRRVDIKDKLPNKAHIKIKQLQDKYPNDIKIITQNVDNLFEKAGCKDVLHLHGFLTQVYCEQCGFIKDIGYQTLKDAGETCIKCGSLLRPNIVFFEEMAPKYEELNQEIQDCDFIVIIGTSGNVVGVNSMASFIPNSILNNLEPSNAIDETIFKKVLYKSAVDAIDEIASDIEEFLSSKGK
jgi:NAD-dependent deacetylase